MINSLYYFEHRESDKKFLTWNSKQVKNVVRVIEWKKYKII